VEARILLGLAAAAALLAPACARRPAAGEPARPGYVQKGDASWYGPKFHGRTTANGETYNMMDFTAAHRSLPFNTLVQVTTLHNKRQLVVRINDRGPFVKGRIIDLSYTTAKILGVPQQGVLPVRLAVMDQKQGATMLERQRAALKKLGVRTWTDEEMASLTRR
jgi:rare lipoprotein A